MGHSAINNTLHTNVNKKQHCYIWSYIGYNYAYICTYA